MQQPTTVLRYEVNTPSGTFYTESRAQAIAWAQAHRGTKTRITMIAETREHVPLAKRPAKAKGGTKL